MCCQFGSYIKLSCTCCIKQQPSTLRSLSNAFTFWWATRQLFQNAGGCLTELMPETRKISYSMIWSVFLKRKSGAGIATGSGNTLGKPFLLKLRDVLWYIDGHHGAFENRSFPIPEVFKAFDISSVRILDHNCNDPIELLYYSTDFSPICVYCASEDLNNSPTSGEKVICYQLEFGK